MEENYEPKIKLFQQRAFGEKVNVTFDFLKENFKPLFKIVFIVEAPVILLISIFYTFYFNSLIGMASDNIENSPNPFEMGEQMGSFFTYYSIIAVLGVIAGTTFFAIVIRYVKLYQTQPPTSITIKSMLPTLFRDSAMLFGAYIMYVIAIVFGFLAFFIPGIYFMIAFSMAFTIVVFEEENAFNALGRSIKLIKGKWWSTFGLLFVMGIIQTIITMIFSIPTYALMVTQMFTLTSGETMFEDQTTSMTVLQSVFTFIAYMGAFFCYSIGTIAISFQYFNLREKHESVGLIEEIDNLSDEH